VARLLPTTARIGELIGAQPVTVQEAELSQALATGVVDGLITSSATGADNKLFESLKYYYNVQAWIPKNAVTVSKKAFGALDKSTQEAVLKALPPPSSAAGKSPGKWMRARLPPSSKAACRSSSPPPSSRQTWARSVRP
jgi:hypothetical protein